MEFVYHDGTQKRLQSGDFFQIVIHLYIRSVISLGLKALMKEIKISA